MAPWQVVLSLDNTEGMIESAKDHVTHMVEAVILWVISQYVIIVRTPTLHTPYNNNNRE